MIRAPSEIGCAKENEDPAVLIIRATNLIENLNIIQKH